MVELRETTPGVKSIYLARRHPTLSREKFVPRWRAHGSLAMGLAGWRHAGGYTHGDVLEVSAPAGLHLDTEDYFGVGMVWFPGGEEALRQLVEDPEFPRLYEDELEAFGDHVEDLTLLTQETVALDSGPVGIRLIQFLTRPSGQSRDEFWSRCREVFCGGGGELVRYTENRSLWQDGDGGESNDRLPHHSGPSTLSGCEGVIELGFPGPEQLLGYCGEHDFDAVGTPGVTLVVNEVVLAPPASR